MLHKLQNAGVTLNMEKCEPGRRKVKFLSHILSANGLQPDPDKTYAVKMVKEPSNTGKVWIYLDMVNQLGKFLAEAWPGRER